MNRDALFEGLPERILQAPGAALYSGWSTFQPGDAYIMEFTPWSAAGDLQSQISQTPEDWSAYTDDVWRGEARGGEWHQQQVAQLVRAGLATEPREVFAMNAIFQRNAKADAVAPDGFKDWKPVYQPIHLRALSVVRPRLIITLGNAEKYSAFALLRGMASRFEMETGREYHEGKFARASFALPDGTELSAAVVGTPHPSRFTIPDRTVTRLREIIWG